MTTTKYVVALFGFEYDDNFYSPTDTIQPNHSYVYSTEEEAEKKKKDLTFDEIFKDPTEGNFGNLSLEKFEEESLLKFFERHNMLNEGEEEYYNDATPVLTKEMLLPIWEELYPIIKDFYFKILKCEQDADVSELELKTETKYLKQTIVGFSNEDNKFVLHSEKDAAIIEIDDYDVYKTYYLNGKTIQKDKWNTEVRKIKIKKLVDSKDQK